MRTLIWIFTRPSKTFEKNGNLRQYSGNLSLDVEALTKQNGVRLLGKLKKPRPTLPKFLQEEIGNPHLFFGPTHPLIHMHQKKIAPNIAASLVYVWRYLSHELFTISLSFVSECIVIRLDNNQVITLWIDHELPWRIFQRMRYLIEHRTKFLQG